MKYFSALSGNRAIIVLFVILSLPLLLNHEPWRDEAQAWLIARDSPDIASIVRLMGYESSPALWHFILFPLARLELPYYSMAVVNFLLILGAIVVFVNYAPFSKLEKILFSFGYYVFYEYSIIVRNYAVSVLFLFLIALMYRERFNKPVLYSLLLVVLANTNVHSLVIAIILCCVYVFELVSQKNAGITRSSTFSILVLFLGFLISIYQLQPPADLNPAFTRWNFELNAYYISTVPGAVIGAFLPIPQLSIAFWNKKLFDSLEIIQIVGTFVFLLSLGFFIKKPRPMLIYLLLSAGLFSIFFFKHSGNPRHHGFVYMIFIFCLWISSGYEEKTLIKNKVITRLFSQKNLSFLFAALLFFQLVASSVAFYYEFNYDFSAGKKAAAFLKDNGLINNNTFIATYPSPMAASILPYIPRPYSRFYYIEYQDYRSFIVWNKEYSLNDHLPVEEVVQRVNNATINKDYNKVIIITNSQISASVFSEKYDLIASFDRTIADDESFYIYQLK
ncbi:MAG: hypothetical protein OIN66_07920 [Candidatus Methanoperedens sp.]|nr:hypothetical protein [Candidatus Methanoperedens sp.]